MEKKCIECGKIFEPKGKERVCSKECKDVRAAKATKKWLEKNKNKKLVEEPTLPPEVLENGD